MSRYSVSPQAVDDLFEIWRLIARDDEEVADRVESEFYELFDTLGRMPGLGHQRSDLTRNKVLFFPLYSYLIVYQPGVNPIRIVTIIHGRRNVKRVLKERL
ncbi:MAG: type II toxin-antitoxin system RelE/ParE family toxin [Acidobacteriia bacterium]|nr:type II toxin-antitoxin system RelE/ParE family toxin [Terriglobia bacterium]